MNDLEYLNQISAKPAPVKPTLFDKKTKLIAIIAGATILLAIIFMSISGSSSSSEPTATSEFSRLFNRSTELEKTLQTYTPSVKSSSLRSSATTLSTLVTELKTTTKNYLINTLAVKPENYPLTKTDSSQITALNAALEKARLNGILDRTFAFEIYYEIQHLTVIEDSALALISKSSDLSAFLTSSKESLEKLGETFNAFSESN